MAAATLAFGQFASAQEAALQKSIQVRIVDEKGAPVEGAEVGSMAFNSGQGSEAKKLSLGFYGERNEPMHASDGRGRVMVDPKWVFYSADDTHAQSLIAWTPDMAQVGFLKVTPGDAGREMELKVAPVCRVTVKLASTGLTDLNRKLTWSNVYVYWNDTRPIGRDSTTGVHEFFLPPGEYKLYAYGRDTYTEQPELKIEAGEKEKTIEVNLAPDRLVQLIGKPAPELAKIKGWKNGKPVTLAELKGKVVLLDFWGYWCGPCVHSMPELMTAHDKYKDQGLVVIAVHDDSVESIAEMDQRLEKVRAEIWKGRDMPFLVALDGGGETRVEGRKGTARGATTAAYGINSFPTTVLIDREGNVVGRINVKESGALEKAMGK